VMDELDKERQAARAVDETFAPAPTRGRIYVARRARWYQVLFYGPALYLVAVVLHLVTTVAAVAIALRLYGVR